MRTKDVLLKDIENIRILCQYLYMDEKHKVTIKDGFGIPREFHMDENLNVFCKNLNFPDNEPTLYNDNFSPRVMIDIIHRLKDEPAVEFPKNFSNRWEEITTITLENVALNHMEYDRL